MIEDFIEWYVQSQSIINPALSNSLSYVEYTGVFGVLGVIAVLFEAIRNSVKHREFTVSNEYLIGVILLFVFAGALKPTLDLVAYLGKSLDKATSLTETQKATMLRQHLFAKKVKLSMELDTLVKTNDEWFNTEVMAKKAEVWINEMEIANNLMGVPSVVQPGGSFGLERILDDLIGSIRALLKMYYIAMMNILYLVIPIAFAFSIFKPSHFLKSLGVFLLYAFVLACINFIEYVIYILFLDKTIDSANGWSMIFSSGAFLFNILSAFIYLRAMWLARLIIPVPGEDVIGPMVGQAFMGAVFLTMQKLNLKSSAPGSSGGKNENDGTQGPVQITTDS